MVGEMRDLATATIAMQASLTGHLVLSTLHTNNSVASLTRLRDLGIPSYLIASTIIGIIAQRLVRAICPRCKTRDDPSQESLEKLALVAHSAKGQEFYRGAGCEQCGETGYSGRTGIYEMLVLSQRVREYIAREATEATIRQLALSEGMKLLVHAGREKILQGVTSVNEVLRVIQTDEGAGTMCPACGEIISPDFVACPLCGCKLIRMCGQCNMIVDKEWVYCPYCSREIPEPEGEAELNKAA
jgi:type II secretory ATPase GspE/PulE/Tfp pilus assembly ATPase PilB-like protein/RNA polymerase subunit RPABC4/transcription elongation factor Spt4